mgnify:CR=1 FL=1
MAKTLKVTLTKSTIGCKKDQIATVEALGLRKLNKTVILPDNAATRGMVALKAVLKAIKEGKTVIGAEEMERAGEYVHEAVAIPQITLNPSRFNTANLQEEIVKGISYNNAVRYFGFDLETK